MKLAFSTLGCPFYNMDKIIGLALQYGYQGIEIRAVSGTTNLDTLEEFRGAGLKETAAQLRRSGLQVACVGTGVRFAQAGKAAQEQALEQAKYYMEVAAALDCRYIRTFGGPLEAAQSYGESLRWIKEGYQRLSELAGEMDVLPLLETHDDFSTSARVLEILEAVPQGTVGAVWDILHPYRFGQGVGDTFQALRAYIRHVHIKDAAEFSASGFDIVPVGKGKLPVQECLSLLTRSGYGGFYSLEWEKLWHSEIAEPEEAFPLYVEQMARYQAGL